MTIRTAVQAVFVDEGDSKSLVLAKVDGFTDEQYSEARDEYLRVVNELLDLNPHLNFRFDSVVKDQV